MNTIIAEIETRLEVCCSSGRFDELAALKLAVEYVGKCDCCGCIEVLRAIAEKLGVKP